MDIIYSEEKWSIQFFEKVVDHAERIEELRLNVLDDVPNLKIFTPLLRPSLRAPIFQVLDIQGFGSLSLTRRIFNGETPSLRKLELREVGIPWYSFQLGGLTVLTLEHILAPFRPNMMELQSVLRCMPNIVRVCLREALPSAHGFLASADFDVSQRINLPRLSRLFIEAPLSTVVAFLSCVNIPSTTKMKLRCQSEDITTLHDFSSLSSLLAQRFCLAEDPVPSLPTIRSLAVQFSFYSTDFIFSAPHCDCGHLLSDLQCEVHWCRNIPLQLVIGLTRSSGQFNPVTGYVRCIVSAKYVEGVDIDGCTFPGNFWVDTLGHFQELRYLKVTASATSELLSALSLLSPDATENQEGYVGQGSRLLYAPGLEELELGNISNFRGNRAPLDTHLLRTALSIRKEQGRALKRLVINDCVTDIKLDRKDLLDFVGMVSYSKVSSA